MTQAELESQVRQLEQRNASTASELRRSRDSEKALRAQLDEACTALANISGALHDCFPTLLVPADERGYGQALREGVAYLEVEIDRYQVAALDEHGKAQQSEEEAQEANAELAASEARVAALEAALREVGRRVIRMRIPTQDESAIGHERALEEKGEIHRIWTEALAAAVPQPPPRHEGIDKKGHDAVQACRKRWDAEGPAVPQPPRERRPRDPLEGVDANIRIGGPHVKPYESAAAPYVGPPRLTVQKHGDHGASVLVNGVRRMNFDAVDGKLRVGVVNIGILEGPAVPQQDPPCAEWCGAASNQGWAHYDDCPARPSNVSSEGPAVPQGDPPRIVVGVDVNDVGNVECRVKGVLRDGVVTITSEEHGEPNPAPQRDIWALAEAAKAEVDTWPAWKRRAADTALISKPAREATPAEEPTPDLAEHVREQLYMVDDLGSGDVFFRVTRAGEMLAAQPAPASPPRDESVPPPGFRKMVESELHLLDDRIAEGKGTWPHRDYVTDEQWARWQGKRDQLRSVLRWLDEAAPTVSREAVEAAVRASGIFAEIAEERARQDAKWGPVRRQPNVDPVLAKRGAGHQRICEQHEIPTADRAKFLCKTAESRGECSFTDIVVEELCEAVEKHDDEAAMRVELIQLAASVVKWIEALALPTERPAASGKDGAT